MQNSFRQLSNQAPCRAIRDFVFFILFYLYLWLEVDLRLIHHGAGIVTDFPVFYRGWAFFRQFISYPGGPVEYLAAFLSQFWYYSWAGALVVTLVAWLFCECSDLFFKAINAAGLRWVRFIVPILSLILYSRYAYHFVTTVALLTALLFVCLYLKITSESKQLGFIVFLAMSVILHYLAGGAYLLFASLCVVYEVLLARRWQLGLLYLLLAAVIPYVEGVLVFGVGIGSTFAFSNLPSLLSANFQTLTVVPCILYLLLPSVTLGLGLWRIFAKQKSKKPHDKFLKLPGGMPSWYCSAVVRRWVLESLVLFVVAGSAVLFFHDSRKKAFSEADYYASHKMWPQVLAVARRFSNNPFIVHAVNRALYHTGRFSYDMFSYPQHSGTLFLTTKNQTLARWKRPDICIDLGLMNIAEVDLSESMETFGEQPVILERLALINMVRGNIGAARIYLGALSKTLFNSGWAENYLDKLDTDPNLSTDKRIQYLRSVIFERDYITYSKAVNLPLALLEENSKNRMAFEYLMAGFLLAGQLEQLVQNLDWLDNFDYAGIPRLYEEAILLYMHSTKKTVDLHGRQISPQSHQRYKGFMQTHYFYGQNRQAAMDELARDYGDSYFFYYFYGPYEIKR